MASKVEKRGLMALILVLVISSLPEPALCIYWNWKFHVHLVNAMSDNSKPLMVHLKSKDNDLQEHSLWKNGDFQFHFKINFWETTLFYCTFKHGTETKTSSDTSATDADHDIRSTRLASSRFWPP
ncbi:hypothetical protein V6Z11_D09G069300 [Gossypium hirsutum]